MDGIFLTIAGFHIEIVFHEATSLPDTAYGFREYILTNFNGFIDHRPKKVDFRIHFLEKPRYQVVFQIYDKTHFLGMYRYRNAKEVESYYHISFVHLQMIMREILQTLVTKHHGFMIHASASLVAGRAYVFVGKSGAGKSTMMTQLSTTYPSLADDTVIIKKEHGTYYFYQTPFFETNNFFVRTNTRYPLGKFFFLKKSSQYKIESLKKNTSTIKRFMEQFFTNEKDKKAQFSYLFGFLTSFDSFYLVHFGLQNPKKLLELMTQV